MYKSVVHIYEYRVLGAYNFIKTTEPTEIKHVSEDENLFLHATAFIDGEWVHIEGGRKSGPHGWCFYKRIQ